MADLDNELDLTLEEISAVAGTTSPRLQATLSGSTDRQEIQVHSISTELEFHFPHSGKHITGPVVEPQLGKIRSFNQRGKTEFNLQVELTREDLDTIEEFREGEDIKLDFSIWVTGKQNDELELGRFSFEEEMIPAQWHQILDDFDYHDKRQVALDLRIDDPEVKAKIETTNALVQTAEEKHNRGDYPGAISDSRRAIETLDSIDELESIIHERKYDDFDDMMGKFESSFLGGMSHAEDKTGIDPALPRDSEFALNFTKACARYISKAFEDSPE